MTIRVSPDASEDFDARLRASDIQYEVEAVSMTAVEYRFETTNPAGWENVAADCEAEALARINRRDAADL